MRDVYTPPLAGVVKSFHLITGNMGTWVLTSSTSPVCAFNGT